MDERLVEEEDPEEYDADASHFYKSLRELRELSSQLYYAADYCKTAFLSSPDKTRILQGTKEYVAGAVVVVVDHLGTMSADLECCISEINSVCETERKLDGLKQRIGTCQDYSCKISLARFHWGSDFSRFHCRYISLPGLKEFTASPSVFENWSRKKKDDDDDDGLQILPKFKNSVFKFQETEKIKRGVINWKVMEIAGLIKRGKRLLS